MTSSSEDRASTSSGAKPGATSSSGARGTTLSEMVVATTSCSEEAVGATPSTWGRGATGWTWTDDDAVFVGVDGRRDVIFCGRGEDAVYHGPQIDLRDRFHGCETFMDHP